MSPKPLKDILKECFSMAKATPPIEVEKGKLYKWKGSVTSYVEGMLELRYLPNFGPVLFDSSAYVSCIVVDPVKNMKKFIELCNHAAPVLINEAEFVVEIFVVDSKEHSLVHLLLNAAKSSCMKQITPAATLENCDSFWSQKIIPLKISSTIQTPKSCVICFVLVMLVNEGEENKEELVWIILRDDEVVWKDLLVPYRMFNINVSQEIPKDYFRRRGSINYFFDPSWDASFSQMLHHKDLIKASPSMNFPKNSDINILDEHYEIDRHVEKWFHISDPDLKSKNFASIYGIIKEIKYVKAWKTKSCSWCKKFDRVFEETISDRNQDEVTSDNDDGDELKREWCVPASTIADSIGEVPVHFPEIRSKKTENEKISGFGIRGGKLTVQITLQKNYSNRVAYVFLKRWKSSQYPAGLVPGVTACFTDMNVQRTKKKYFYFISTPLTRVVHLEATSSGMHTIAQNWGSFGFPFSKNSSAKCWGVLELDLLTKVSITARCKECNTVFLQYRCSNVFCTNNRLQMNPDYNVKATARLFVRGFEGCESTSLYLTDENVRKYLCLPGRIWHRLRSLSANSELLYLCSDSEINEENCDIPNIYFRRYCKFFRPRPRYHVHCKPFKNEANSYFCLDLMEINESRVSALRSVIERKSKSSDNNRTDE